MYNQHHVKFYARALLKKQKKLLNLCEECNAVKEEGEWDLFIPKGASMQDAKVVCDDCRPKIVGEYRRSKKEEV